MGFLVRVCACLLSSQQEGIPLMFIKRIAVAAACLVAAVPVWASSQVSASISNFKVTVDAGSFNWVLAGGGTQLSVGSSDYTLDVPTWPTFSVSAAWVSSGSAGTPLATLEADTANTVMPVVSYAKAASTGSSLSAFASTPDSGGDASAFASWQGQFTLGKDAKVTFTWVEDLTGANTGGDLYPQYMAGRVSQGLALTDVKISNALQNLRSNTTLTGLSDYNLSTGEDAGFVFSSEGNMRKLVVSNFKSDAVFNFSATARVNTVDYANAVPEPETYALVLAGLGTLAAVGRRRRGA